jgi:hypothetical protein
MAFIAQGFETASLLHGSLQVGQCKKTLGKKMLDKKMLGKKMLDKKMLGKKMMLGNFLPDVLEARGEGDQSC